MVGQYSIELLTREDLVLANEIHGTYRGVRTQDAVMLAVAINRGVELLTADRKLVEALICTCSELEGYRTLKSCNCSVNATGRRRSAVLILAQP